MWNRVVCDNLMICMFIQSPLYLIPYNKEKYHSANFCLLNGGLLPASFQKKIVEGLYIITVFYTRDVTSLNAWKFNR